MLAPIQIGTVYLIAYALIAWGILRDNYPKLAKLAIFKSQTTIRKKALVCRMRLLGCAYVRHGRNTACESQFHAESNVTNCHLLRIVACCELSPVTNVSLTIFKPRIILQYIITSGIIFSLRKVRKKPMEDWKRVLNASWNLNEKTLLKKSQLSNLKEKIDAFKLFELLKRLMIGAFLIVLTQMEKNGSTGKVLFHWKSKN